MRSLVLLLLTLQVHAFVVLLDPGHGGEELGAVAKHTKGGHGTTYEKDLSLMVAKEIKRFLEPRHTVYLTRSLDRDLSLADRSQLADTVKADIFVSIHFNSYRSSKYKGFETYYLDNHKNRAIKKVEEVENTDIDGSDKVVNQILIDLIISKTTTASRRLASLIHKKVAKKLAPKFKMKDRGIKPGLFYVLALSKRPAVLLEGGFMSNPSELKKIKSKEYMQTYAHSVADGIDEYLSFLTPRDVPLF